MSDYTVGDIVYANSTYGVIIFISSELDKMYRSHRIYWIRDKWSMNYTIDAVSRFKWRYDGLENEQ